MSAACSPSIYSLLANTLRSQLGLGLRGLAPKLMGTTAGAVGLVGLGLLGQDTRSTAYKPSCFYWTMNRVYCDTPASFARYGSSIRQGLSGAVADVIAPRHVEGAACR